MSTRADMSMVDDGMTETGSSSGGPRRMMVVIVLPLARAVMALVGLAAIIAALLGGYWMAAGPERLEQLWTAPPPEATQSVVDLPETIVNLRRDTPSRFLKIGISIVVAPGAQAAVSAAMPRLVDALQEFLRNLDENDLDGSAGLHRLRSEIKRRFNLIAAEPNAGRDPVADVLLRSLLTQ